MGNKKISMKTLATASVKRVNIPECSICSNPHLNIEVMKLTSAVKDYTHFTTCPNIKRILYLKLEK